MQQYKFVKNYKDNNVLRNSFNQLAKMTFGIDFEQWYKKGYWNDNYICYSYIDNNKVIANVSVNKMSISCGKEIKKAIQIGTVMTMKKYRNKGLATALIEKVREDYYDLVDFIYLFGNQQGLSVYLKSGFVPIKETNFYINTKKLTFDNYTEVVKQKLNLNDDKDLKFFKEFVKERVPVSKKFGVIDDEALLMFYCFSTDWYYYFDLGYIVSYKISNSILHLYDIISQREIDLVKVLKCVDLSNINKIVFHFTPDISMDYIEKEVLIEKDCTLLMQPIGLLNSYDFRFPKFSHA